MNRRQLDRDGDQQPPRLSPYESATVVAVLFGISVVAFQPFWTSEYAMLDDYPVLMASLSPRLEAYPSQLIIADGRVLYGVALDALFNPLSTIGQLWIPRLIGVLGTLALGLLVTRLLRSLGEHWIDATLVGAALILLPPMVIWASWAVTFSYSWSAVFGFAAGMWFLAALRRAPLRPTAQLVSSGVCVVISLLIYQPGALFFWCAFLLLVLLGGPSRLEHLGRLVVAATVFFGVSCLVYLALWRMYLPIIVPELGRSERAKLVAFSDLPAKFNWFVREPLMHAANLFSFGERGPVAAVVACLIVAGVWIGLRRRGLGIGRGLAVVALLVVLSYSVNIAVSLNWSAYRTLGSLATTLLVLTLFAAKEILGIHARGLMAWRAFVAAAVLAQALVVRYSIAPRIIGPQQQELAIVRHQVRALREAKSREVLFRLPHWSDNRAALYRYDEIGPPSSSSWWTAESMVGIVFYELEKTPYDGRVTVLDSATPLPSPLPTGTFSIDMGAEYAQQLKANSISKP